MTGARAFINERTRISLATGTMIGTMLSIILGTAAVLGAYHSIKLEIDKAQGMAAEAMTKANEVKTDVEKVLGEVRSDVREIRGDVKALLQQKR